jgi:hypothetical protein
MATLNSNQKFGMLIAIINRTPTIMADGEIRPIKDINDDIEKEFNACLNLLEKD